MAQRRRTRDDDEFDELVGAAWLRVHRTALLLTGDADRADALARRTFERTWADWPRARRDDPLAFAGGLLVGDHLEVFDGVDLTPDGDTGVDVAPDPALLRRLGWQRRERRRAVSMAGAVVLLVAVLGSAIGVRAMLSGARESGLPPDQGSLLSDYEQRVLTETPGAYAVGGTVVVPGPIDPGSARNALAADPVLQTGLVPLGTHLLTGVGDLASTATYPAFMHGPEPIDSQVVADVGPGSLGCLRRSGRPCELVLVASDHRVGRFQIEALDAPGFLEPEVETQVFLRDVYVRAQLEHLVVGGVGGTAVRSVMLTLDDGSTRYATVDRGRISPGDSVFWAVVDRDVRSVTAFDASDQVVNRHTVRSCDDPSSCRVR